MTAAINEACIGWLLEKCYFVRGVFLVPEIMIFLIAEWDYLPIHRVSLRGLVEGAAQSSPGRGNKARIKEG